MNNAVCGKTIENLKNRICVKLASNKKDYLKWTSKPSYMSPKIFDNNLVAIRKNKVTLTLNKPAYAGMCILDLSKELMYEFPMITLKINMTTTQGIHSTQLLFTYTDSLMCEIKTKDVYEDFSKDEEMFDFSNYSTKSKNYDESNKLVVSKMKDETGSVVIDKFVELKPTMYYFLLDGISEHTKAKGMNKNVVATIRHNEYKDVLLNKKCLRHSMNRITKIIE